MKTNTLIVGLLLMGFVLVGAAQLPNSLSLGGEEYAFVKTETRHGQDYHYFTAEEGKTVTVTPNAGMEISSVLVDQIAQAQFDSCQNIEGCSAFKESCATGDVVVQHIFKNKEGKVFSIALRRIATQGEIVWEWSSTPSLAQDNKGIDQKLKKPLSVYRWEMCQLNVF